MAIDREGLARTLRDARENRGMSQQAAAKRLGLSRTVIAQIELGNRPVSEDELSKLSAIYEISVADLTGAAIPSDDVTLAVLDFAPELLLDDETKTRVTHAIDLFRQAAGLDNALGNKPQAFHPRYMVQPPRSASEAILQGERAAEQERRRIGLGALPVGNVGELLSSQGVRSFAIDLPEGFSGLFVRHASVGAAILVNSRPGRISGRYAVLHQYAHALFEGDAVIRTMKRSNAGELISKRANAFVAAFLLSADGVRDFLEGIGKGQPSRKVYAVFDGNDEPIRAEYRSQPGSQAITCVDVAAIARRFGASYKTAVLRLLSLDIISDSDSRELLSAKRQRAAEQWLAVAGEDADHQRSAALPDRRSGLKAEILHLAIECYRRDLIKKDRLAVIAEHLQVPELSKARLIEFAQAAR